METSRVLLAIGRRHLDDSVKVCQQFEVIPFQLPWLGALARGQ